MISKYARYLLFVLAVALYLYLQHKIPFNFRTWQIHDDGLMVNRAIELKNNNWFGIFDSKLLSKDYGYSFFIFFISKINIDYAISIGCLRVISAVILMIAIGGKLIETSKILLFSLLIIYNPIPLYFENRIIYRDELISILFLLIMAIAIIILRLINSINSIRDILSIKFIFAFLILYILVNLGWSVRQKTFWLDFIIIFLFIYLSLKLLKTFKVTRLKFLMFSTIVAFMVVIIPSYGLKEMYKYQIARINFQNYGFEIYNDYSEGQFPKLMRELSKIEPTPTDSFITISNKQRTKVYNFSKDFSTLQPILEDPKSIWAPFGCQALKICSEVSSAWFYWAFRDALQDLGHFSNLKSSQKFMEKLTNEVELYCASAPSNCANYGLYEMVRPSQINLTLFLPRLTDNVMRSTYPIFPQYFHQNSYDSMNFSQIYKWSEVIPELQDLERIKKSSSWHMSHESYIWTLQSLSLILMIIGLACLIIEMWLKFNSNTVRLGTFLIFSVLAIELFIVTFIESNIWGVMGSPYLMTASNAIWTLGAIGYLSFSQKFD